jgi:hypothetical protein
MFSRLFKRQPSQNHHRRSRSAPHGPIETLESRTLLSSTSTPAVAGPLLDPIVTLSAPVPSDVLLATAQPRDLIFDSLRNQLLVIKSDGVERRSASTGKILGTISIGQSLFGADVSDDQKYLFLSNDSEEVFRIDLDDGTVFVHNVSQLGLQARARDVVLRPGGALVSRIDENNADYFRVITVGEDYVSQYVDIYGNQFHSPQYAVLARSADFQYTSIAAPDYIYSHQQTGGLIPHDNRGYGTINGLAVSRTGLLHAVATPTGVMVENRDFELVKEIPSRGAGVAFDPSREVLYVADPATDEIDAYDAVSWDLLFSVPIGEDLPAADPYGAGVMAVSDDGKTVYLATLSGVRMFNLAGTSLSYGNSITIEAAVAGDSPGAPLPTGVVKFVDSTTLETLGQSTLTGGIAELRLNNLHAGSHTLVADYEGDGTYNPASSTPIDLVVTRAITRAAFTATGAGSAKVTIFSPGGAPEGGTVTLFEGTTIVTTAAVHAGIASLIFNLNPSPHSLHIDYSGNSDFLPTSAAADLNIKADTTTILSAPASATWAARIPLQVKIGAPPGFMVNSGQVQFKEGNRLLDSAPVSAGTANLNYSFIPGTHRITATYSGDSEFNPSTSQTISINVIASKDSIKLTTASTFVPAGQPITFRATLPSAGSGAPTGKLIFKDGTRTLGSATAASGTVSFTTTLAAGAHSISASLPSFANAVSKPIQLQVFSPKIIDLMVLYTSAAANSIGNASQVQNSVRDIVAQTNHAFWNSRIPVALHLVYISQIDYTESGRFETDLKRLTGRKDGFMDSVHTLRNHYHADLVSLLERDGNLGGLGWELRDTHDPTNSAFGFSVVLASQAAAPYYAFAHELGHNLGATHDAQHAEGKGATAFSNGWRFRGKNGALYHDIMSYDPGETIPYFSNPRIKYQGVPTGNASSADSARTITLTAGIVASYRR